MAEPTVGMQYGNYDSQMNKLKTKYKKGEPYQARGYSYQNNAFYDKNNKQVAIFEMNENHEVRRKNTNNPGGLRYNSPDNFTSKKTDSSYFIQTNGLKWSGTSKGNEKNNFTRIDGDSTYAVDGANGCPKDGIVQKGEIMRHN